jgi:hypothetical protein
MSRPTRALQARAGFALCSMPDALAPPCLSAIVDMAGSAYEELAHSIDWCGRRTSGRCPDSFCRRTTNGELVLLSGYAFHGFSQPYCFPWPRHGWPSFVFAAFDFVLCCYRCSGCACIQSFLEEALVMILTTPPNERPGVDAGWRVLFAFQRPRSRATQGER